MGFNNIESNDVFDGIDENYAKELVTEALLSTVKHTGNIPGSLVIEIESNLVEINRRDWEELFDSDDLKFIYIEAGLEEQDSSPVMS